jgi:hypothetical protein
MEVAQQTIRLFYIHFIHVHILREEPGYLTWPCDYILVKVLHYSLIRWETRHGFKGPPRTRG